jgi:AbrB family looped-hinge helix DNA binding protein
VPTVKTHAKGQIIIPKEMRTRLGIEPGKVVFV